MFWGDFKKGMNWNVHFQIKNGSNNRFFVCSEYEDNARLSFFCVFFSPFFSCAFYIFIWCFGRRMFSIHMENFVEFRLNDRNSTLKLNVSQTIFVLHMQNVCSEWMNSGVRMNLIHWMQNPFVNENVCQCESGNLMTCRGLNSSMARLESLVVNLNFTPLHPSFHSHWNYIFLCHITRDHHIWPTWKWRIFCTQKNEQKKLRKIEYSRPKRIYANKWDSSFSVTLVRSVLMND